MQQLRSRERERRLRTSTSRRSQGPCRCGRPQTYGPCGTTMFHGVVRPRSSVFEPSVIAEEENRIHDIPMWRLAFRAHVLYANEEFPGGTTLSTSWRLRRCATWRRSTPSRAFLKCAQCGTDLEASLDSTDTGLLGHMRQIHGAQEHNAESIAQLHQLDGVPAWCAAPCVPGEPPTTTCLEEIDPQEISSRETSSRTTVNQATRRQRPPHAPYLELPGI